MRASLHFVQAVVPPAEKHPHRRPELRLSMLLGSGWRIQAHRCSCYRRNGSCRLPKTWLGANGGVLFLWERLPERQRRPARGRQLPESTLKDAPPVLPGAIWLNSSKIAERVVLAETEKVLPREPLTAYERDPFSTNAPTNCNQKTKLSPPDWGWLSIAFGAF